MKNIFLKLIIVLAAAVLIFITVGIVLSRKLSVKEYTQKLDGIKGEVKIVFISDLHCRQLGGDNEELAELIRAQKPDIIAFTGDLISRGSKSDKVEKMCEFMQKLRDIAPTYFSLGNHERDYLAENGSGLLQKLRDMGIHVLECEYEDLSVNGSTFRLGGMSERAYYGGDGKYDPDAEPFLRDYCETELPKIMLSHRPEAFGFKYACQDWDVDLILSGHTHGGLIRLPLIGGLVAPMQGLFPDFYYGEYELYETKMIITSGLAGYGFVPRIYNPCEICAVTLTSS